MALSLEDVRRIARLARLSLTPDEERTYLAQLSAVLEYMRELQALDVSAVEPMTHALAGGDLPPPREDVARPGLPPERVLAAAPARQGNCFKVPRIIE